MEDGSMELEILL